MPELVALAPVEGKPSLGINHATDRSNDGALWRRYRELIALSVAFTIQSAYYIDTHTQQAHETGAKSKNLPRWPTWPPVRASGTLTYSLLALRLYDQASS